MSFKQFRRAREVPEVNLIPVMNLFVVLIPFLLMSAAFYHVSVIPTSLPSQTDESSDIAADEQSVTVNIVVEPDQIQISASSALLDEETLSGLSASIPKKEDRFDLEMLGRALYAIKLKYEKSDTVILLPSPEVEYQDVVMILDTAREITVHRGTRDEQRIPLFPVVVLSTMVQGA